MRSCNATCGDSGGCSVADLSPQIATAQRLISRYGRPVTLEKLGPSSGGKATVSDALQVDAVFVGPSSLGFEARSSALVRRAEQIALVAPGADVKLDGYERLQDDGTAWAIVGVEVLRPGDQTVLGYLSVKR